MARKTRTTRKSKQRPAPKAEDGRIRRWLSKHGLRLGLADGRRVLEHVSDDGEWSPVAHSRPVRTWAAALIAAVQLGLCPVMPHREAPTVNEQNFTQAGNVIRNQDGEPVIKLTDYQMRAVEDDSRIVILCWCRQAGKDFTTSLKAVLDAIDTGESWYIVSLTQRQAEATAKKAQMHVRAILGVLAEVDEAEEWVNGVKITSYGVKLPNGGEVIALPGRDPDALAGLTGNVIFTEMALFPNNGEAHWKVVAPLATRGFKIWAISTPRGPETRFSRLRRNTKGLYSVHNVDIYQAVEDGLVLRDEKGETITPDELREIYDDEAGWDREYRCIEGDDHTPLVSWKYIHDCGTDYTIETVEVTGSKDATIHQLQDQFDHMDRAFWQTIGTSATGPLGLGWDIATSGDFSAIALGEKILDTIWLRVLVIMHGVEDYDYQEEIVTRAMELGGTGRGDMGGIGREACQRIQKRFGEHRFAGFQFTAASKTPLMTQLRDTMQSTRLRYPSDNELIKYDIHALGRTGIGIDGGILRVETNRNTLDRRSHADIATAIAMMVDALQGADGPAEWETVRPGAAAVAGIPGHHPVAAMIGQQTHNFSGGLPV